MNAQAEGSKVVHTFAGRSGNRALCGINLYTWRTAHVEATCKRCSAKSDK